MTRAEGALEAIERAVDRGGDADDVLRAVVAALHVQGGYPYAAILCVEDDDLRPGPAAGRADAGPRTSVPVAWQGVRVAELVVGGAPPEEQAFLERVAVLIGAHCLVGWDTGGEAWEA